MYCSNIERGINPAIPDPYSTTSLPKGGGSVVTGDHPSMYGFIPTEARLIQKKSVYVILKRLTANTLKRIIFSIKTSIRVVTMSIYYERNAHASKDSRYVILHDNTQVVFYTQTSTNKTIKRGSLLILIILL